MHVLCLFVCLFVHACEKKSLLTIARRTFKVAIFIDVVPHEAAWARPVIDNRPVDAPGVHITTVTRLVVSVFDLFAITDTAGVTSRP